MFQCFTRKHISCIIPWAFSLWCDCSMHSFLPYAFFELLTDFFLAFAVILLLCDWFTEKFARNDAILVGFGHVYSQNWCVWRWRINDQTWNNFKMHGNNQPNSLHVRSCFRFRHNEQIIHTKWHNAYSEWVANFRHSELSLNLFRKTVAFQMDGEFWCHDRFTDFNLWDTLLFFC